MLVQLRDNSERPMDIVRAWFTRLIEAINLRTGLVFAAGSAVAGLVFGWALLPEFALTFLSVVFISQFGEIYVQARISRAWTRLYLPPPSPVPPTRLRFLLTGGVAVVFVAESMAVYRWVLGVGWDSIPFVDRWSPWTVPCAVILGGLPLAEALVSQRMRAEIRRQCREADDMEAVAFATFADEKAQRLT
jgi:hypothetical protein